MQMASMKEIYSVHLMGNDSEHLMEHDLEHLMEIKLGTLKEMSSAYSWDEQMAQTKERC